MNRHLQNCSAPICLADKSDDVVWIVGEPICRLDTTNILRENQIKLNDLFRRKKVAELAFTGKELEKLKLSKNKILKS